MPTESKSQDHLAAASKGSGGGAQRKSALRADVFRQAAREIERYEGEGMYSCLAVRWAADVSHKDAHEKAYAQMFGPSHPDQNNHPFWTGATGIRTPSDKARDACRILALLFMAAMIDSGDI